jgi:hypothetical protein
MENNNEQELIKGNFKTLFEQNKNNPEKNENLKAGYYRTNDDACGECLKCIGAMVCLDAMCGCCGGSFCG